MQMQRTISNVSNFIADTSSHVKNGRYEVVYKICKKKNLVYGIYFHLCVLLAYFKCRKTVYLLPKVPACITGNCQR